MDYYLERGAQRKSVRNWAWQWCATTTTKSGWRGRGGEVDGTRLATPAAFAWVASEACSPSAAIASAIQAAQQFCWCEQVRRTDYGTSVKAREA